MSSSGAGSAAASRSAERVVGSIHDPGLDRLHHRHATSGGAQRARERAGDERLADAGVGAGDEEAAHASVASRMASRVTSRRRSSSAGAMASGGISTMTLPSGRRMTPRARAAAHHALADARGRRIGRTRRAVRDQLDADHEALLAHVADVARAARCPRRVARAGARSSAGAAPACAPRVKRREARERDGARERVAGVGVAVEEGAELLVAGRGTPRRPPRWRASPPAAGSRR